MHAALGAEAGRQAQPRGEGPLGPAEGALGAPGLGLVGDLGP